MDGLSMDGDLVEPLIHPSTNAPVPSAQEPLPSNDQTQPTQPESVMDMQTQHHGEVSGPVQSKLAQLSEIPAEFPHGWELNGEGPIQVLTEPATLP